MPDLFYSRVSMGQFPLPGISDNILLALRPNTLCQCSEMIPWQHGTNFPCKQTQQIMLPPCYKFYQVKPHHPSLSGAEGMEGIQVTFFDSDLVIRTFKNPANLPFPLHSPLPKNPKECSEKHFRVHTSIIAKFGAWWLLCFQI